MNSTPNSFSRVNRPQSTAENYYSLLSPFYDLLALSEKKFIKSGLDVLDPQQGETILEIGSGTGFAQLRLARIVGSGHSIGLDLSTGMCRIAGRKITRSGITKQPNLIINNSVALPFPSCSFDGIFSSFTLELFDTPQIPVVLSELLRVLRPGGRLCVVSLSKDRPLPMAGRIYERMHNRFPTLLDCRPIPARLLVENAGFLIKRDQYKLMWGLPVIILLGIKSE